MEKIKSRKLKKGDTIAVVSPSWGGPHIFPHVYELGINTLKDLGLKIKEYPSARKDPQFLYHNPQFRADDVNRAFADREVDAIITSIGGDDSVRILPFLDLDIITNNPKIFLGFSDTTTINSYLNQVGLVTLNGPAIMAGFAQWNFLPIDYQEQIKEMLFENPSKYEYRPFDVYSNGYVNWNDVTNSGKVGEKIKSGGWNWLQGECVVHGELFGGCIEVLEMMKNTKFWPAQDFWKGKILFFETSEDKPSPDQVKFLLRNYGMQGIFNKIEALIIGRSRGYSDDEKIALDKNILDVIRIECNNERLPIVTNMDFGHTDPQWILPLGIRAEIDCVKKSFKLLEKPFL